MTADLKIGRRGQKPPMHWVPLWCLEGVARVFGYGARKYAPGNWVKAAPDGQEALQDYLSAALRHLSRCQDGRTGLVDLGALDGESGLPHLDHAICSLVMLRGLAVLQGELPADPGQGGEA